MVRDAWQGAACMCPSARSRSLGLGQSERWCRTAWSGDAFPVARSKSLGLGHCETRGYVAGVEEQRRTAGVHPPHGLGAPGSAKVCGGGNISAAICAACVPVGFHVPAHVRSSAVGRPCGPSRVPAPGTDGCTATRLAACGFWPARVCSKIAGCACCTRFTSLGLATERGTCNPERAMLQQIMRAAGLPGRASAHSTNSCCAASVHGAAACIARAWLAAALDQSEAKLCSGVVAHCDACRP